MSYSSIATVLHDPNAGTDAFDFAIGAARLWSAHLHVVCTGVDSTDPGFYYAGAQAIAVQQNLEMAQDTANDLEAIAKGKPQGEDIDWDVEVVTTMTNGLVPFLTGQIRYADLVVLPLPYGAGCNQVDVLTFEACLFDADATRYKILKSEWLI